MTEQPQEPASPADVADTPQTPTETAHDSAPESAPEDATTPETAPEASEAAPEAGEASEAPAAAAAEEAPAPRPTPTPAPGPRPTPGPGPRPTPTPARGPETGETAPTAAPAAGSAVPEVVHMTTVDREAAAAFGRVDENGTVWVRRADGEHEVGAYPDATPEEAIAYFVRKFGEVVAQVDLFDQRLRSTELAGKDIVAGITTLRTALAETRAVGDLDALAARVEALATVADEARAAADRARAAHREELRAARLTVVEEAESIAGQDPEKVQWRASGERLRTLFEEWKAAQRDGRLDKRSEDELWKRFSHARSAFDKMRRHHFAALGEQRTGIRSEKEQLVHEAEELSTSTDWRGTTTAYRALMDRWKAAGRLGRKDDDVLWDRFRAAQDVFFAARTAANEAVDEEFRDNLVAKEALLVEAEALLPIKDLNAAKKALNSIQDRWEAAGKVPRNDLGRVEGRLRAVETAVRDAEQARWSRSNPETQSRAGGLASQLESAIRDLEADVEKARAGGDARALARAEEALRARRAWLDAAQASLRDGR